MLQSLIDDIINSVNILAERALNSVEQGLLNAAPATIGFKARKNAKPDDNNAPEPGELAKDEIETGTHQLETLMCTSIDRNFDKLEIYVLRNILCVKPIDIRNWIQLGHYEGLDFSSAPGDAEVQDDEANANGDKPTLGSIGHLRRKLRESMRLNALLHEEQQRNEQLLADLRGLVGVRDDKVKDENASADDDNTTGPLAFLRDGVAQLKDAGGDTPLSTTTAFTLSQLQALRALSTSLRTMAPHLKPAEGVEEVVEHGNRSWRRERLEYVESATRRHLETVQGLELGEDGEIRDGEWQAEGRNLAKGEVESLERVASLLGGEAGASTSASRDNEERMDES